MNSSPIRAVLVDVTDLETPKEEAQKRLAETERLINTYGGIVVIKKIQKRAIPDYETYIGSGKLEEIIELAKQKKAELLISNNILKPRQIFALEEKLRPYKIKVWDRIDLILKIFAKHAQSTEAKLQIELASIRHMGPRIFGMGIELSQQTGAMGLRGGPGEANVEIMKRHLQKQELSIMKKLSHYEKIQEGQRNRRRRQHFKTASLVGYTNAGKSALLNALTKKGAYVADKLFATLDTRIGKLYIPSNSGKGQEILISDTIGFIQDLPPALIQAFKSTLAETIESDLILHVIDIADPEIHKKIKVVEEILTNLKLQDKPKLYVFNKTDLIEPAKKQKLIRPNSILKAGKDTAEILGWSSKLKPKTSPTALKTRYRKFSPVFVSAEKKENLENLIGKIKEMTSR
ncbi:MAG: GTPase HflX [Candidatus Peregrinibacteria bacterium]